MLSQRSSYRLKFIFGSQSELINVSGDMMEQLCASELSRLDVMIRTGPFS